MSPVSAAEHKSPSSCRRKTALLGTPPVIYNIDLLYNIHTHTQKKKKKKRKKKQKPKRGKCNGTNVPILAETRI